MKSDIIIRLVRALSEPYFGAWTIYKNQLVRFSASHPNFKISGVPGRICYIQNQGPIVICKDQGILTEDYLCPKNPSQY